jgi:hypothetical protein
LDEGTQRLPKMMVFYCSPFLKKDDGVLLLWRANVDLTVVLRIEVVLQRHDVPLLLGLGLLRCSGVIIVAAAAKEAAAASVTEAVIVVSSAGCFFSVRIWRDE